MIKIIVLKLTQWCLHRRHSFIGLDNVLGTKFIVEQSLSQRGEMLHIDGLGQERRNSNVLAMELRLSCTNPSICNVFCHGLRPWLWPFHSICGSARCWSLSKDIIQINAWKRYLLFCTYPFQQKIPWNRFSVFGLKLNWHLFPWIQLEKK